jgi:membrane-associated phospholipid phosphatase
MAIPSSENRPCQDSWRKTLIIMTVSAMAMMSAASYWDEAVTATLIRWSRPGFNAIMGRTLFEGHWPGANDAIILMWIAALALYIGGAIGRAAATNLKRFRPHAGFVLTTGLLIGLLMVHGLKYFMGRARPSLVLGEAWPYSLWFVFGPHTIAEGGFSGSFPSGHTAQAFTVMAIAYVLAADPLAQGAKKAAGWFCGALALMFTAAMGYARCASQNHWLTDVAGSICLGWLFMHWIYFGLLRVPQQRQYWAKHGCLPQLRWGWELMLCIDIFLVAVGIILVTSSARSLLDTGPWWHAWLIPAGTVLVWVGIRLFLRGHQIVHQALCPARQETMP